MREFHIILKFCMGTLCSWTQIERWYLENLEDPGVDGIFEKWDGGMDWIDLAQDRDGWRALVNPVMNLQVS
jgi:hypothetical protein